MSCYYNLLLLLFSLYLQFHAADSTLGSTQETSVDDFMVPTQTTTTESQPGTKTTSLKGTEVQYIGKGYKKACLHL